MDNSKLSKTLPIGRNKGVLFILLDAFRWDYVTQEDAPTIFDLTKKGIYVKKLVSSSGFTQRSAIFTGALPVDHGNYTMYVRDPESSPFKVLKPLVPLLRHLPHEQGFIYKVVRKFINQIPKVTASYSPPGRIPAHLLPQISVVEDLTPIDKKGTLSLRTIFDEFREAGIEYKYYMAPVSSDKDEELMRDVQAEIVSGGQVFFAQFADTDGLIHKYGVNSPERHEIVRETDERVRKLISTMEERFEDPWIVICGDHGMMDVNEYFDVWKITENVAKKLGFIHGKDYLMFLDSTLARYWFFKDEVRDKMFPLIEQALSDKGSWIDDEYRQQRSIPHHQDWYGQKVWRANVGIGIFPDYFHGFNDRYIGMHGYDCLTDPMKGVGIIANNSMSESFVIQEGGLESMCSTLCDLLDLPTPSTATGKSFLRQINV